MNKEFKNIKNDKLNIALIHDWYKSDSFGGGEKTVKEIFEVLKIHTSLDINLYALYKDKTFKKSNWLFNKYVKTSFIQDLPLSNYLLRYYLPLFPIAIEQFNLEKYKVIVSSSHSVAKGVLTSPDQIHISYVHTPMRYAWDLMNLYISNSNHKKFLKPIIRYQIHKLRIWDQLSSQRIDKIIANSNFTARRIKKYWGRESKVIFPPVDVDKFNYKSNRGDFYLSVCRLVINKRVDLLVRAFNHLNLPLVIVGDGPEKENLKKIANKNIEIIGFQNEQKLIELMETCKTFVYAGIEDFGISIVEALAAGAPIIAYGKAGILDTVNCFNINKKIANGILFKNQTYESIKDCINWYEDNKIWKNLSSEIIRQSSLKFSKNNFKNNFNNYLLECINDYKFIN